MRSKFNLLATVSSLALLGAIGAASAADLPARPVPVMKAPPAIVAAHFDWSGFYTGVHGGYGWGEVEQRTIDNQVCTSNVPSDCPVKANGGVFGGFAGYNWQSGRVIFGVEADASWTGVKHTDTYPNTQLTDPVLVHGEVRWLSTVRGRLGMAMSPTLIYLTGGVAFGGVNSSWTDSSSNPSGVTDKKTKTGWVAGGGFDHAFTKSWLVRVEVLYHDLGRDSVTRNVNSNYTTQFRHTVTVARAGLAYRW